MPEQLCGTGFDVIDEHAMTGSTVYLLGSGLTDNDFCVVTIKTRDVGRLTRVAAYLKAGGASEVADAGSFLYYAGPIKQSGSGCLTWGGSDVGTPPWRKSGDCAS